MLSCRGLGVPYVPGCPCRDFLTVAVTAFPSSWHRAPAVWPPYTSMLCNAHFSLSTFSCVSGPAKQGVECTVEYFFIFPHHRSHAGRQRRWYARIGRLHFRHQKLWVFRPIMNGCSGVFWTIDDITKHTTTFIPIVFETILHTYLCFVFHALKTKQTAVVSKVSCHSFYRSISIYHLLVHIWKYMLKFLPRCTTYLYYFFSNYF